MTIANDIKLITNTIITTDKCALINHISYSECIPFDCWNSVEIIGQFWKETWDASPALRVVIHIWHVIDVSGFFTIYEVCI